MPRSWTMLAVVLALAASALAAGARADGLPPGVAERSLAFLTHDGLVLSARLTLPQGEAPRAGVVLLHGSGATDMDQTVGPELTSTGRVEKPLRQLAWRLAREGFAVLRYNKRGTDTDSRLDDAHLIETASLGDLVADARAAVALLRSTGLVPADRIVLVGHSEGSIIGSLVAAADPQIAGLACLAPLAHSLRDILHYQLVDRIAAWTWELVDADHDGRLTRDEIANAPRYHLPLSSLDADGDGTVDHQELARGLEREWDRFAAEQTRVSPWLAQHFALEPNLTRFPRLSIPIQLFHGEEDAQSPVSESRALMQALANRPRESGWAATLDTFPGLGHGFSPPLAKDRPTVGPIDAGALETIAHRLSATYLAGSLLANR